MSRSFNDVTSEYLTNANGIVTAAPLTIAAWFFSDDDAIAQDIVSIINGADEKFRLLIGGNVGGDPIRANTRASAVSGTADSTTGYSANTWHHACAVFTSSSSRAAFIDGGSKGTDTTNLTPSGLANTYIGTTFTGGGSYMSGRIAEVAIYNAALTDAEVAILALGYRPIFVRPQSLVAYWPLIRDEDQDIVGGFDMTPINTPSTAPHPPLIKSAISPHIIMPPTAAPAGLSIPVAMHNYRQRRVGAI